MKGEIGWKLLRNLILGAAGVILLIGIVIIMKEGVISKGQETQCLTSVRQNSGLNQDLLVFATEIDCPTKEVTIKDKIDKNEMIIKERIAQEMRSCWYNFGKGELQLFHDTGQNTFCSFCSIIRFKDKGKELKGMKAYLMTHPLGSDRSKYWDVLYPNFKIEKVIGEGENFLSGIVPFTTIRDVTRDFNSFKEYMILKDPAINTNNDMAIVYVHGQYTGSTIQRWLRGLLSMEGIIANSAVTYIEYTPESVESLKCTSFPIEQLQYIDFSD